MDMFKYSNAVADWNYLVINYKSDNKIAGFGFVKGQYYLDFGF